MTGGVDLVVWRHGRTEWNDTGRFQGHLDPPLDEVGRLQAKTAASALAALAPAAIVSSDLARARDTAACLGMATGLEVAYDTRLRELDVGAWGGLTRVEVAERFPETYAAWLRGEDVRREGGETVAELATRVVDAVEERLADVTGPLVVVTHGAAARALVVGLLRLPPAATAAFAVLDNARWARLAGRPGGWRLTAYNVGVEADPADAARGEPPVL